MNEQNYNSGQPEDQKYIDGAIRIAFLGLIAVWCFLIFKPFVTIIMWSMIIAVTAYPLHKKLTKWLGGREGLAATTFVIACIAVLVIPSLLLTGSIIESGKNLTDALEDGTLHIPPPDKSVKEWVLVGEQVYSTWSDASSNLQATLQKHSEQVTGAMGWLFHALAGIGVDILLTLFSFIIAGILLVNADAAYRAACKFFDRMIGREDTNFGAGARDTIRSVVKGVILVAAIQAVAAWIGFKVVDLPAAGVWAVLVLALAIMQLPPMIILLPIAIYVFSYASTGWAIAFLIWAILVSISDGVLKPMFLGKGLDTPMLVILIGALGGMVLHGILGLFIGAVVMAIGYELYVSWLRHWQPVSADSEDE